MHLCVIPLVIGVIKMHYYQCCRAGDFSDNTTVRKTDVCMGYLSRACSNCNFNRKTCVCIDEFLTKNPVGSSYKNRKSEDANVPVSHAVGRLKLLYNNTSKHYDSILSKNTVLLILPLIIAKWQKIKKDFPFSN